MGIQIEALPEMGLRGSPATPVDQFTDDVAEFDYALPQIKFVRFPHPPELEPPFPEARKAGTMTNFAKEFVDRFAHFDLEGCRWIAMSMTESTPPVRDEEKHLQARGLAGSGDRVNLVRAGASIIELDAEPMALPLSSAHRV